MHVGVGIAQPTLQCVYIVVHYGLSGENIMAQAQIYALLMTVFK